MVALTILELRYHSSYRRCEHRQKRFILMSSAVSPFNLVVMGVSGCGKSTVAEALARKLNGHFADGDDFHPPSNVDRMSKGIPLSDTDRMPWLEAINQYMRQTEPNRTINVVACSALKRIYRDTLADSIPVLFVHLAGDFALIEARSKARTGHFMNVGLLQSQFDTLEPPTDDESVVTVRIDVTIDEVIENAVKQVKRSDLFRSFQQQL